MKVIPILTIIIIIAAIIYYFFPNPSKEGRVIADIIETSTSTIQIYTATDKASNCYDSDAGMNIYSAGYINSSGLISYDTCQQDNVLIEKYCSDGSPTSISTRCPGNYSCIDNRCQYNVR